MERSCKLHSINFGYTSIVLLKDFLSLVGIRFEGGKLFSARDIEVNSNAFLLFLIHIFTGVSVHGDY